jgi:hypothetical protein
MKFFRNRSVSVLPLTLALLSACNSNPQVNRALLPRVTIDTTDGEAWPQGVITSGGSEFDVTRTTNAPNGGTTKLAFWSFINPDCSNAGYATVRETTAGEHGSLSISKTDGFAYWPEKNPRSACNKQRVPGVLIEYKAKAGYTGIDHVGYDIFAPGGGLRRVNVTVNVI